MCLGPCLVGLALELALKLGETEKRKQRLHRKLRTPEIPDKMGEGRDEGGETLLLLLVVEKTFLQRRVSRDLSQGLGRDGEGVFRRRNSMCRGPEVGVPWA